MLVLGEDLRTVNILVFHSAVAMGCLRGSADPNVGALGVDYFFWHLWEFASSKEARKTPSYGARHTLGNSQVRQCRLLPGIRWASRGGGIRRCMGVTDCNQRVQQP